MKFWLVLFGLFAVQYGFSQSIARVALGNTYYASKIKKGDNEAAQNGITLAFFFPLRFSAVDAHLKMGVSRHPGWVNWSDAAFSSFYRIEKMYSCTNEILVGKKVKLDNGLSFVPQLGIGALGEFYIFADAGESANVDIYADVSLLFQVQGTLFSTGLLFNLEKDFGWSERQSNGLRFRSQLVFGL